MIKQGFTLIELLAVIVILSIIMLIATPTVLNIIEDAKKGSLKNSAYGIIKAAEYDQSRKIVKGENPVEIIYTYTDGVETSNPSGYKLEYRGTKPNDGVIKINNKGDVAIAIHDGNYCAEKSYTKSEVKVSKQSKDDCILIQLPGSGICGDNFADARDNNIYETVKIGSQCWFAEDLRYDCSLEGYTNVGSSNSWSESSNCGNQGSGYNGLLYQWPVAMKGSTEEGVQGLCPVGWHIPTDNEWKELEIYLGMTQSEADKSSDYRGTDQGDQLKGLTPSWCKGSTFCGTSGFNALPAGYRTTVGSLSIVGSQGSWWTSSPFGSSAWRRDLSSSNSGVYLGTLSQAYGRSVRCLLG